MSGGGTYSLATRGAKDVIDAATPLVTSAIERMNLRPSMRRFGMMDLGCADGGTSLDMIHTALRCVRAVAKRAEITITYADQPRNDFNALVGMVHGLHEHGASEFQTSFQTYVGQLERVYPLFSANSFYVQAIPDNSLDLGFSATAMHWLSAKPSNLVDHIHMVGARGEERDTFARHAARDWQTILLCRAREMKRGARLVLVNFCRDQQGRYLGNTDGINMFDTFNQIWQAFLDDGEITREEYENMTLPQYYNTVEEFSRPLVDKTNPCYRAGLRLENIETRVVKCPFASDFKNHGDLEKFADGLIPTLRSWNQSIFFGALNPARALQERSEIIESYYAAYRDRVLRDPHNHGMDYVHAYKTIRKI